MITLPFQPSFSDYIKFDEHQRDELIKFLDDNALIVTHNTDAKELEIQSNGKIADNYYRFSETAFRKIANLLADRLGTLLVDLCCSDEQLDPEFARTTFNRMLSLRGDKLQNFSIVRNIKSQLLLNVLSNKVKGCFPENLFEWVGDRIAEELNLQFHCAYLNDDFTIIIRSPDVITTEIKGNDFKFQAGVMVTQRGWASHYFNFHTAIWFNHIDDYVLSEPISIAMRPKDNCQNLLRNNIKAELPSIFVTASWVRDMMNAPLIEGEGLGAVERARDNYAAYICAEGLPRSVVMSALRYAFWKDFNDTRIEVAGNGRNLFHLIEGLLHAAKDKPLELQKDIRILAYRVLVKDFTLR